MRQHKQDTQDAYVQDPGLRHTLRITQDTQDNALPGFWHITLACAAAATLELARGDACEGPCRGAIEPKELE